MHGRLFHPLLWWVRVNFFSKRESVLLCSQNSLNCLENLPSPAIDGYISLCLISLFLGLCPLGLWISWKHWQGFYEISCDVCLWPVTIPFSFLYCEQVIRNISNWRQKLVFPIPKPALIREILSCCLWPLFITQRTKAYFIDQPLLFTWLICDISSTLYRVLALDLCMNIDLVHLCHSSYCVQFSVLRLMSEDVNNIFFSFFS